MDILKIKNLLHKTFIVGIFIKGIDGVIELIVGIILFFVQTNFVVNIVQKIFRHELIQDPADFIANFSVQTIQNLSASTLSFIAVYFMIYGFVKISLFWGLWNKKLWVYPTAGIILFLSILYQFFRIFHTQSKVLIFLTLIDVLILILLRFEYKRLKISFV